MKNAFDDGITCTLILSKSTIADVIAGRLTNDEEHDLLVEIIGSFEAVCGERCGDGTATCKRHLGHFGTHIS